MKARIVDVQIFPRESGCFSPIADMPASDRHRIELNIEIPSSPIMREVGFIHEGANKQDILDSFDMGIRINVDQNIMMAIEVAIEAFVEDFMGQIGRDGIVQFRLNDQDSENFHDKLKRFETRWSTRIFKSFLESYRLGSRMNYEDALVVIQEYFIITPVMST